MMHGTHNVTLTHCNMMHGTHNVKLPFKIGKMGLKLANDLLSSWLNSPLKKRLADKRFVCHERKIDSIQ